MTSSSAADSMDARSPNADAFGGQDAADLIQTFYDRATSLKRVAGAILGVIFLLLCSGGYIFYAAREIAVSDVPSPTDDLISSINARKAELEHLKVALEGSKQESQVGQRTTQDVLVAAEDYYAALIDLKLKESKLEEFQTTGRFEGMDVKVSFKDWEAFADAQASYMNFLRDFLVATRDRFAVGEVTQTDVSLAEAAHAAEESRLAGALDKVESLSSDDRGAQVGGRSRAQGEPVLLVVQTNITRFGTLIVIFFFIAVLTPLYRYNMRLAAFYDAKGDAIRMLRGVCPQIDPEILARILTPEVNFEKGPRAPVEQSFSLAKELIKKDRRFS